MSSTSIRQVGAEREGRDSVLPPTIFPPYVLSAAGAGDHAAIHRLLRTVLHRPSVDEFQNQLEEPYYEPSNRLVAKRGVEIVAHALLTQREMNFCDSRFAVSGLHDLVTLPEYREQGLGGAMLVQAERQMQADGAVLGLLTTDKPGFFETRGWSIWPPPSSSYAGARNILSLIRSKRPKRKPLIGGPKPSRECNIRLFRAVEQPALVRLYEQFVGNMIGPLVRTEAMWRWLAGRRGFDRIYIAIDGPDRLELDDQFSQIVGYAVVRGGVILELITDSENLSASRRLLERVCGDAIEHDHEHIRIDAPPGSQLHQLMLEAGGRYAADSKASGVVRLAKLFDQPAFVQRIESQFIRRLVESDLGEKCELGFNVDGVKHKLSVSRRRARLEQDNVGRSYITCSRSTLQQLLLGHWRIEDALKQGVLVSSTRVATKMAETILPKLPVWRTPFDEEQGE